MQSSPAILDASRASPAACRDEPVRGLGKPASHVAPKFCHDRPGSKPFEAITELDEYCATRTEAAILDHHRDELVQACGVGHTLVDLGAGRCAKATRLFGALRPNRYVAVDIASDFLHGASGELQSRHLQLPMLGLGLDFTAKLELPPQAGGGTRLMFYLGSGIGNFAPEAAVEFLGRVRAAAPGGALLIGVDLVKPAPLFDAGHDDALGVTAAFNPNLLRHVKRLLGSNFDVRHWCHAALFDAGQARVEMHLEARCDLQVDWPGGHLSRRVGERIHTEHSCKHTVEGFDGLLRQAGYADIRCWTDPKAWFAVFVAR